MSHLFPDELIIQAFGFGPVMTARQSIQRAKMILCDLEKISPWRRPFNVSGCTAATGDMPIAEDLSDFDEVVMRALQSYDDVHYYNEKEPDNWQLTIDSVSPYGFVETFSNAPTIDKYKNRVSIDIQSSGIKNKIPLDDSMYSIEIRAYECDNVNAAWSQPGVVYSIFDYLIDNYNPLGCVVFATSQLNRIDTSESSYNIGWLNYSRDPKVVEIFSSTGKAILYHGGVLLKFGDDISVLSDPKIDEELAAIRKTLRSAGVTA
jgi:hypothetical protein